jgi:hypothetical protein
MKVCNHGVLGMYLHAVIRKFLGACLFIELLDIISTSSFLVVGCNLLRQRPFIMAMFLTILAGGCRVIGSKP